jgi:hypothetical protein
MRIDLEFVESIPPEANGKYRFCVSKVATEFLRSLAA